MLSHRELASLTRRRSVLHDKNEVWLVGPLGFEPRTDRLKVSELDVQYLLGHSSPMMVRRYSATYDSEQAAKAHAAFSPAMQL